MELKKNDFVNNFFKTIFTKRSFRKLFKKEI